jgi:hypothetical protein
MIFIYTLNNIWYLEIQSTKILLGLLPEKILAHIFAVKA